MALRCQTLVATLTLAVFAVGCSTTKSTFVHRGEMNEEWEDGPKVKGVPTTLQVISHLNVEVVEEHLIAENGGAPGWLNIDPTRHVRITPVKTERIVMVDPKRPFSGELRKGDLTFTGQAITKYDYQVTDRTLADITAVLSGQFPVIPGTNATSQPEEKSSETPGQEGKSTSGRAATGTDIDSKIVTVESVVASMMFDVEAPDLEYAIQEFLAVHLNNCHTCADGSPVTPGCQTECEEQSAELLSVPSPSY